MSESGIVAHPETDLARPELERPGLAGRIYWISGRIAGACLAFYFLGFLFAYVYLKTLNVNGMWRPHHIRASLTFGTLVLVFTIAGWVAFEYGCRMLALEQWRRWRLMTRVCPTLLLVDIGLLVVHLVRPRFAYAASAYTSVFAGTYWSMALALLGLLYTIAVLAAQSPGTPAESAQGTPGGASPAAMAKPAEATRFVLRVLVVIEVVAWVLIYVVR